MRIKILSPRIYGTTRTTEKEEDETITAMKFFYITCIYDVKIEDKVSNMNTKKLKVYNFKTLPYFYRYGLFNCNIKSSIKIVVK